MGGRSAAAALMLPSHHERNQHRRLNETCEVVRAKRRAHVRPAIRLAEVVERSPDKRARDERQAERPVRLLRQAVGVEGGVKDEARIVLQVGVFAALRLARAALGGDERARRPRRVIRLEHGVVHVAEALQVELRGHGEPGRLNVARLGGARAPAHAHVAGDRASAVVRLDGRLEARSGLHGRALVCVVAAGLVAKRVENDRGVVPVAAHEVGHVARQPQLKHAVLVEREHAQAVGEVEQRRRRRVVREAAAVAAHAAHGLEAEQVDARRHGHAHGGKTLVVATRAEPHALLVDKGAQAAVPAHAAHANARIHGVGGGAAYIDHGRQRVQVRPRHRPALRGGHGQRRRRHAAGARRQRHGGRRRIRHGGAAGVEEHKRHHRRGGHVGGELRRGVDHRARRRDAVGGNEGIRKGARHGGRAKQAVGDDVRARVRGREEGRAEDAAALRANSMQERGQGGWAARRGALARGAQRREAKRGVGRGDARRDLLCAAPRTCEEEGTRGGPQVVRGGGGRRACAPRALHAPPPCALGFCGIDEHGQDIVAPVKKQAARGIVEAQGRARVAQPVVAQRRTI